MIVTRALKNENGSALIFTLLALAILTLLGIAAGTTTTFELQLASSERDYQGALYAAEAQIAVIRGRFRTDYASIQSGQSYEGIIGPYRVSCTPTKMPGSDLWNMESTAQGTKGLTATVAILAEIVPDGASPSDYGGQDRGGTGKNSTNKDARAISDMTVRDFSF